MTDGQLVERVRKGDLEALGELYERHHIQVFRIAMAITHNQATAEDVLQEVFLKVHRYADRIDTTVPLMPWLYRVTVNLCYTLVTRQKRWSTPLDSVVDTLGDWIDHMRQSPERQTEKHELKTIVRQAINDLNEGQKNVIVLYYLSDLSLKEIAEVLQLPEGTIKSRLYYGRENLRKKLEDNQALFSEVAYEFT